MAPRRDGFTLIELLVVISIIALLIGLLIPALGRVRDSARATKSLSNVRQWGIAQLAFAADSDGLLAWAGDSAFDNVAWDMQAPDWWAHILPPYVGQPSYRELGIDRETASRSARTDSIFIDPAAQVPPAAPYQNRLGAESIHFYFNYVPSSALPRTFNGGDKRMLMRMPQDRIPSPSLTVLMLEMRSTPDEVPKGGDFRDTTLDRAKSNWKRVAGRHDGGGHYLFADGHGDWFDYRQVTDFGADLYDARAIGYNRKDMIWDPLGPTGE